MLALIKRKPTNPPAWYQGLELTERPEPQVSTERPIKVKIVSAGICGTDIGIYLGKDSLANAMARVPSDFIILGHEFCGQVVDVHPSAREEVALALLRQPHQSVIVKEWLAGKTASQIAADSRFIEFLNQHFYATAEMHFTCGQCLQCRTGDEHVCKRTIGKGMHEDGAFTDFMVLPANRLVLIEKGEVPPQIISFMDALGNAVHTAQAIDLVGKTVLITGAGVQGLGSCAVARLLGANKIFVTDVVSKQAGPVDKLGLAKKLGADAVFDVGTETGRAELAEAVARETDNTGVDVVFEMAGHYSAYETAFANIRMGGTLLLLGLPAGKLEVDFSREIIFKGLRVQGIYGRRVFDTWNLMRYLLSKGLTQTIMESGMITHELSLSDFKKGFQALINGQAVKVLLKPQGYEYE